MKKISRLIVAALVACGFGSLGAQKAPVEKKAVKPATQVPYQVPTPLRPPTAQKPATKRTTPPRYRQYSEDKTLTYDATIKEIYPEPGAEAPSRTCLGISSWSRTTQRSP